MWAGFSTFEQHVRVCHLLTKPGRCLAGVNWYHHRFYNGSSILVELSFFGIFLCIYRYFLTAALGDGFVFYVKSPICELYDGSVLFTIGCILTEDW